MRWVAPTEKDTANKVLEKRLWDAADQFRANSGLKAGQYSTPVLGLIFLRFAEARFAQRRCTTEAKTLVEIRAKVEKHIKNSYLKRVDAPVGVKPALRCWMELNEA